MDSAQNPMHYRIIGQLHVHHVTIKLSDPFRDKPLANEDDQLVLHAPRPT